MKYNDLVKSINSEDFASRLASVYSDPEAARARILAAVDEFCMIYGSERDMAVFSTPGRSEVSGNHTDHNHGRVIACAVERDAIAVASPRCDNVISIKSAGFSADTVDSSDEIMPDEKGTSASLIRGMRAGMRRFCGDAESCGFDAYTTSNVLAGSGLSSSAAFEVLIGTVINHYAYGGRIDAPTVARVAQYAENEYFGKPCGLMDQTACAVGGVITIDFGDPERAVITPLDFDFTRIGYSLCITNTGGSHANLTDDYASIPAEMKAVAGFFGKSCLRGLTANELFAEAARIRAELGDRALIRAYHFICENERVAHQADALISGDLDRFLALMLESGSSSFRYLQNVFTTKAPAEQGLSLALALSESILSGTKSAWRVHGGGFAGTIQALMPSELTSDYSAKMDAVFGKGACMILGIRPIGAVKLVG